MYAPYGPFFAVITEVLPRNVSGGAIALINSLGALGSFVGAYVVGYLNGVTGDYSRGAAGFWVENGAIAYPVHEITIAGSLKEMYQHIVAIGSDVDTRGGIRTGSVLLENMTIAGE